MSFAQFLRMVGRIWFFVWAEQFNIAALIIAAGIWKLLGG